jgi:uncharacterized protein (DUF952 family)
MHSFVRTEIQAPPAGFSRRASPTTPVVVPIIIPTLQTSIATVIIMSAENPPQFVYKIVPEPVEEPIPSTLPLSAPDKKDGFIHLSTAEQVGCPALRDLCMSSHGLQVLGTCDRYFSHTTQVHLLKVEFARIVSATKWENEFPHLYGNFGKDEIVDSKAFERSESETWSESLKRSEWLA